MTVFFVVAQDDTNITRRKRRTGKKKKNSAWFLLENNLICLPRQGFRQDFQPIPYFLSRKKRYWVTIRIYSTDLS